MTASAGQAARLIFLARVVRKEAQHVKSTDQRLFTRPLVPEDIQTLEQDELLAERIEAFVARFGRLQDSLGDKLLPNLLAFLQEPPASLLDNLDKAEKLGWINSTDAWLEMRRLRNQMVHEYIEDPVLLANSLNAGHQRLPELLIAAERMVSEIERRIA